MNRYYGNSMGRFLTPEPYEETLNLGEPRTLNRYACVAGDPINKNDPLGLDPPREPASEDVFIWIHNLQGPNQETTSCK
jgi:hypothetical protein